MRRWIHICLMICVCTGMIPVSAMALQIESVQVGFDGAYKRMRWVPVRLEIRTDAEPFAGEAVVEFTDPYSEDTLWTTRIQLDLPPQSQRDLRFTVFAHWREAVLECRLIDDQGLMQAKATPALEAPLSDNILSMAIFAVDRRTFDRLNGTMLPGDIEVKLAYLLPDELPEQALAYASLDVLVLQEQDLTYPLRRSQEKTLLAWIASGGVFISIPAGPPRVLGQWLPLQSIRYSASSEPMVTRDPLEIRANRWLTGQIYRSSSIISSLQGEPVVVERTVDRGKTIILGVQPGQISDGWLYLLSQCQTQTQSEKTKTVLREHERRLYAMLTHQPNATTPLLRRMVIVGMLLGLGFLSVQIIPPLRRHRLFVVLVWCMVVSATTIATAVLRPVTATGVGMAWCELYPETGFLDVNIAAGLHVPRSVRSELQHTPDWHVRPLRWNIPLDMIENISQDSHLIAQFELSPWQPRPVLFESLNSYPYSVEIDGNECRSHLPFTLKQAYLLSPQGWSFAGELTQNHPIQITWQPSGAWPRPETPSPRHTTFEQILFQEGVIPIQTEQSLVLGWVSIEELGLQAIPVELTGDALVVVHISQTQ